MTRPLLASGAPLLDQTETSPELQQLSATLARRATDQPDVATVVRRLVEEAGWLSAATGRDSRDDVKGQAAALLLFLSRRLAEAEQDAARWRACLPLLSVARADAESGIAWLELAKRPVEHEGDDAPQLADSLVDIAHKQAEERRRR